MVVKYVASVSGSIVEHNGSAAVPSGSITDSSCLYTTKNTPPHGWASASGSLLSWWTFGFFSLWVVMNDTAGTFVRKFLCDHMILFLLGI